jgi:arylsulfatase A-like enzyme
MDDGVGHIVAALEQTGKREEALLVFVSDNGGQRSWHSDQEYDGKYADKPHKALGDNSPLRGWKGQVYEGEYACRR